MSSSFEPTRWSLVLKAQQPADDSSQSRALEELCQLYWKPLYWFVRRNGSSAEQAEDRVQEFFGRLLEGDWLDRADAERGKLRTFLLTLLKRHLNDHRKGRDAAKRGGGAAPVRSIPRSSNGNCWIQEEKRPQTSIRNSSGAGPGRFSSAACSCVPRRKRRADSPCSKHSGL